MQAKEHFPSLVIASCMCQFGGGGGGRGWWELEGGEGVDSQRMFCLNITKVCVTNFDCRYM